MKLNFQTLFLFLSTMHYGNEINQHKPTMKQNVYLPAAAAEDLQEVNSFN